MRDSHDFSFSGVKTALLHMAQAKQVYPPGGPSLEAGEIDVVVRELAAAFQESVVDVMVAKLLKMADQYGARGLVLGGGVSANARLRERIRRSSTLPAIIPSPILCTDNGAMIASCGYFRYQRGDQFGLDLDIDPGLSWALDGPD
jgi:N6-L-threonylcarbamoyladenine synthase